MSIRRTVSAEQSAIYKRIIVTDCLQAISYNLKKEVRKHLFFNAYYYDRNYVITLQVFYERFLWPAQAVLPRHFQV